MSLAVIELPVGLSGLFSASGVLALGGWLKNTICAVRGDTAFVSGGVADLASPDACRALAAAVDRLCAERDVVPAIVAHDLHPDFFSTRLALEIAERQGIPSLAVQHHHAHIAAVCAEHAVTGPVLGLAMDGVGMGTDGQAWGGELLLVEGAQCERLGHLRPLRLPGGDRAAREPWRMGAAALDDLDRNDEIVSRFTGQPAAATVAAMLERGFHCPSTTSLGRLFDAAAGLLQVCLLQSFEGEAAMALQALAENHGEVAAMPGGFVCDESLDFRPLLAALAEPIDVGRGAALFHATLAAGLAEWTAEAAGRNGIGLVACGGGCFLNRLLTRQLREQLRQRGIDVLTPRRVSPGDAGLSLGQAWVGVHHLHGN